MIIKDIFSLIKLINVIKEARKNMKPGIKTSEFISVALCTIVAIAGVVVGYLDPALTLKIVAILIAVYNIGRVVSKMTKTTVDDQAMDKIAELIEKLNGKKPE